MKEKNLYNTRRYQRDTNRHNSARSLQNGTNCSKNNKTSGPGGINMKFLKYRGDTFLNFLIKFSIGKYNDKKILMKWI